MLVEEPEDAMDSIKECLDSLKDNMDSRKPSIDYLEEIVTTDLLMTTDHSQVCKSIVGYLIILPFDLTKNNDFINSRPGAINVFAPCR